MDPTDADMNPVTWVQGGVDVGEPVPDETSTPRDGTLGVKSRPRVRGVRTRPTSL